MSTDTRAWNGSLFRQARNEYPDGSGVGVEAEAAAGAMMLSVAAAAAESMAGEGCSWSESTEDGRVQLSRSAANLA